jgi:hypothetical protein
VRTLAFLLLFATAALGDEIDLSQRRGGDHAPAVVLRAEAGSAFAPYGFVGGTVSWLTESQFAFELGAGGGFPGLQLGLAARRLFGDLGSYLVTEIAIAGNTLVNRGAATANPLINAGATSGKGSAWTCIGIGFEQRTDVIDLSLVGSIVFTTASLTPQFAVHGGIGFGF